MALTIKNLKLGTLGTSESDIVPKVAVGKSVQVDNILFVNKTGTNRTITIRVYWNDDAQGRVAVAQAVNANSIWVMEPMAFSAGYQLKALASAASAIDFVTNGVEKDI